MIFCEKQRKIFFLKIAYVDSLSAKNHFPDKKWISLPNSLPVPSPKQGISLFFRKKTLYNNWISTNTAIYPVSAKKLSTVKNTIALLKPFAFFSFF